MTEAAEPGGLTSAQARDLLALYGPNRIRSPHDATALSILVSQFRSIIVIALIAATAFSVWSGDAIEAAAIACVLLINTAIGFISEVRGVRAMQSLRNLTVPYALVERDGRKTLVLSHDLVPGDLVFIAAGDIIPADLRLHDVVDLFCDESALTGESVPVAKRAVEDCASPGNGAATAYQGTAVTRGSGLGLVTATGMATELGHIAALAESARPETSPLLSQLNRLGGQLVWATGVLVAILFALGIGAGHDPQLVAKTAIALGVAAVPEGLPVVATLVLARGMWRMAQRNAIVRTLSAVEALGATTLLLTDKTGTLTENAMSLAMIQLASTRYGGAALENAAVHANDPALTMALQVAVLCTEEDQAAQRHPDPMETALVAGARRAGLDPGRLRAHYRQHHQIAFSHANAMMASIHHDAADYLVAVKGAPESVLAVCVSAATAEGEKPLDAASRAAWHGYNVEMASEGLRVIALAHKRMRDPHTTAFDKLVLVGLVGLRDPARPEVAGAVSALRRAGVRVVMVTGDHKETACAIGRDVGLFADHDLALDLGGVSALANKSATIYRAAIFARVRPETKLDLVDFFQHRGDVVAMTGDGVNDAPALRKADVGVAMGRRGTEVAREAADIVLRDDALGSIVAAMRQGRITFGNIRIFVAYLLSCNLSEIAVIAVATLAGMPLPLLPLQILFLNLVTDVFPAFALGLGEGEQDVMNRPPRNPKEPLIRTQTWVAIVLFGAILTIFTLAAFVVSRETFGMSDDQAVTIAFVALGLAQLLHVFNMRAASAHPLRNQIVSNRYVWSAVALCTMLIVVVVQFPAAARLIGNAQIPVSGWAIALACAFGPLVFTQLGLAVLARFDARQGRSDRTDQ